MHSKFGEETKKSDKFAASKIGAVAEQSWWRKTSKKRLAEDHGLTEGQVDELRATPEYQKAVESFMLGSVRLRILRSGSRVIINVMVIWLNL